jgi:hypothetical protein
MIIYRRQNIWINRSSHLTELIRFYAAESGIAELDLENFARKHLKADFKVKKAMGE